MHSRLLTHWTRDNFQIEIKKSRTARIPIECSKVWIYIERMIELLTIRIISHPVLERNFCIKKLKKKRDKYYLSSELRKENGRDLVGNGGIRLLEAHRSIRNAEDRKRWSRFPISGRTFFVPFRRVRGIREPTHEHAELSRFIAHRSKVISKLRKRSSRVTTARRNGTPLIGTSAERYDWPKIGANLWKSARGFKIAE